MVRYGYRDILYETMKTWAYSLNSCCEFVEGLDTVRNKPPRETELHKAEMKSRIRKDQIDGQVLRTKIENPIAIFETNQHPKDVYLVFDRYNSDSIKGLTHVP